MSTVTSSSIISSAGSAVSTSTIVSKASATSAAIATTSVATSAASTVPAAITTSIYTAPASTSVVSVEPSSTYYAPATSTAAAETSVVGVTSTLTQSAATTGGAQGPTIVTIYSTQPPVTITPTASAVSTRSSSSSSTSSTQTALSASGNSTGTSSKGLGSAGIIAIAVIIPIAAVVAAVLFGLWFWRRRKNRKNAEEARKNEMAEYGFNPNDDPTLPVGVAYTDGGSEGNEDSGYRGWGATTLSNRKPSTTLGSNSRAAAGAGVGGATPEGGSQIGGCNSQPSPSADTGASDGTSDLLMSNQHEAAVTGGIMSGAVAGGVAAATSRMARHSTSASGGVHRGASNASSAYSGIAHSEVSSDHTPTMPGPYYHEEVPYNIYNEPGHNPYIDNTYVAGAQSGDQPVIRDVQARRHTRIERAPTFPQQGGIAQNF